MLITFKVKSIQSYTIGEQLKKNKLQNNKRNKQIIAFYSSQETARVVDFGLYHCE